MIIESLSVTDFRVFQGRHTFDLSPRMVRGNRRPVILFGGLNGAGKTTTLLAVRLVLYGRLSIGPGTSQKKYEEFLSGCVHRSRDGVLQANHSSIELSFSYAHMGTENHYRVHRSWTNSGKKVVESLEIAKDGHVMTGLSYEQAQGFLDELIPTGVSDLFFFDGEKIADLVADQAGTALAESIKRLLGLDLIEKLHSDLGVLVRGESKSFANDDLLLKIEQKEGELRDAESRAEKYERELRDALPELAEARANYDIANRDFLGIGGAFAATREDEIARQRALVERRRAIEAEMREVFGGVYPLSLASSFMERTLEQVREDVGQRDERGGKEMLARFARELEERLHNVLSQTDEKTVKASITKLLKEKYTDTQPTEPVHDIGIKVLARVDANYEVARKSARPSISRLKGELISINAELDGIGERIARAPDDQMLRKTHDSLSAQQALINELEVCARLKRKEAQSSIQEALAIARTLDELHSQIQQSAVQSRQVELARAAQSSLSAYGLLAAQQKIKSLELEFADCFHRLARKDDLSISAKIHPETFQVTLLGANGKMVEKSELSAGEQQIYAIAMLEALARTSGRKLPIIIDTPLGRLDSKHRQKLVENYFPHASHQVIILSTDTEVDEAFYQSLSKHISHAYKLSYEAESGSTRALEGYFWRSRQNCEAA